jgi:hypothetical protein
MSTRTLFSGVVHHWAVLNRTKIQGITLNATRQPVFRIDEFRLLYEGNRVEALMIFNALIPSLHRVLLLECGGLGLDLRTCTERKLIDVRTGVQK